MPMFNGVEYELLRITYVAARGGQIEPALLAGVFAVESRFDPKADGDFVPGNGDGPDERDGVRGEYWAHGLGQLHRRGAGANFDRDALYDPEVNARASAAYLRTCLDAFSQEVDPALCAYNAGIGYVQQHGWEWNRERYVEPVHRAAATWRPFMVQVATLALIDSIWGAAEQLRRGKSRRYWTGYIQDELIRLKQVSGLLTVLAVLAP